MSQTHTVGTHCTTVARDADGVLRVTYHQTVVVEAHPDGRVRLDSGGYRTPTTKTRMNQTARQYALGFHVYQEKGRWYVLPRGRAAARPRAAVCRSRTG